MGVLYSIIPLNDKTADYLRETGGAVPHCDMPARNPTPAEVRHACASIPDFRTHYNVKNGEFWQAQVEGATNPEQGPWTCINISKFSGAEDEPHEIWFEKGWPSLILEILRRLAVQCGPLVVLPDTGEAPIAVTAEDSVDELLRTWAHTRPLDDSGGSAEG